ncbi:MAG: response regulator, partial [Sphaerotilus sp.]|nr:response regulator [Sphaerotilus sp.]
MNTAATVEGTALRQPRILLVDDDEVNLLLTGVALRERGFTVREASGGRAALAMLADWSPDVLVLDAVMPGLDGFRTCAVLRDLPGFELLPVLMLTGLDDEVSIARAFDAGATDFFVKSHHWSLLAGR